MCNCCCNKTTGPEPDYPQNEAALWLDPVAVIRDLPILVAEKLLSREEARDALKRFGLLRCAS